MRASLAPLVVMLAAGCSGIQDVRAEEVTKGSRTLTIEGTNTGEVVPELPGELLKVGKLLASTRAWTIFCPTKMSSSVICGSDWETSWI
jgi:hypothetical protein